MVEMEPVESSNIACVGYDEANRTAYVRFKSGAEYAYRGVAPEAFRALRSAESVGRHFAAHFRDAYPTERHDHFDSVEKEPKRTIRLWRLERVDAIEDEVRGFVVRAHDEQEARAIASRSSRAEGPEVWLDPAGSLCIELDPAGPPGVLIRTSG